MKTISEQLSEQFISTSSEIHGLHQLVNKSQSYIHISVSCSHPIVIALRPNLRMALAGPLPHYLLISMTP